MRFPRPHHPSLSLSFSSLAPDRCVPANLQSPMIPSYRSITRRKEWLVAKAKEKKAEAKDTEKNGGATHKQRHEEDQSVEG